ncbi:MAG: hypothetical protein Q4F95_10620 [Oscillospiraceae bacterium]|nr:hypothetical protein [Oscillospiraceae bacterium]
MAKNKRSAGQAMMAFLKGFVSVILILILIVSVGINVLFYNDNSAVKINMFGKNNSYFMMNNTEITKVPKGSFVKIHNTTDGIKTGLYVFCTVGVGYKTILCVTDEIDNGNGTKSYVVSGDTQNPTLSYTIPVTRIMGIAQTRYTMVGDVINFTKSLMGIVLLMAVPSFLLIIISIASINKNKLDYEDALLEADIMAEELRKAKKEKQAKKKDLRAAASKEAEPVQTPKPVAKKKTAAPPVPEAEIQNEDIAPVITESGEEEISPVDAEISRKAMEIKNALHNQTISEAEPQKPKAAPKPAVKPQEREEINLSATDILNQISPEMRTTIDPEESAYREVRTAAPKKPQQTARPAQKQMSARPVSARPSAAKPAVKPAAREEAASRPHRSSPKKSIQAQSIDDLIKVLEDEKKKLD